VVAFAGIFLGQVFAMPVLDGVASIIIGLILAMAALLLAVETKSLLIGEAAAPELLERVERILASQSTIVRVNEVLTMHLGPADVLVTLSLDFSDAMGSRDVEATITLIESQIKRAHPEVSRVFVEAQSWRDHQLMSQ